MSSIYNRYLKLKGNNKDVIYLFKSGNFYIFLDDDAKKISKITTLKLVNYSKDIVKCGFPSNSKDKYLELFKNLKLNIELVEEKDDNKLNKYLDKIKDIDLDNITPKESIDILYTLKELL